MSEYIVDVGDANKEYMAYFKRKAEMMMGNPIREEIVRCRDCYFSDEIEGGYWCDRFDCGKEHVTPDGFCAWAYRKSENTNKE